MPQGVPRQSGDQHTSLSFSPISFPPSFLPLLVISSQSIPETGGHLLWEAFLAFSHTALSLLFGISLPYRVPPPRKTLTGFKHLVPAWCGAPKSPVFPPASLSTGRAHRSPWIDGPLSRMPSQPLAQPATAGAERDYLCVLILLIKLIACLLCPPSLRKRSSLLCVRSLLQGRRAGLGGYLGPGPSLGKQCPQAGGISLRGSTCPPQEHRVWGRWAPPLKKGCPCLNAREDLRPEELRAPTILWE